MVLKDLSRSNEPSIAALSVWAKSPPRRMSVIAYEAGFSTAVITVVNRQIQIYQALPPSKAHVGQHANTSATHQFSYIMADC